MMNELDTFTFQNDEPKGPKTTIFLNKICKIIWSDDGLCATVYLSKHYDSSYPVEIRGKQNLLRFCETLGWKVE